MYICSRVIFILILYKYLFRIIHVSVYCAKPTATGQELYKKSETETPNRRRPERMRMPYGTHVSAQM